MDPSQDTESLVRLTANSDSSECGREEKEEVSEEVVQGKCLEEVRRPMPQHVMEKKPPWMSSLLPTPLLPLPTLNFTVSQVSYRSHPAKPNLLQKQKQNLLNTNFYGLMREAFPKTCEVMEILAKTETPPTPSSHSFINEDI